MKKKILTGVCFLIAMLFLLVPSESKAASVDDTIIIDASCNYDYAAEQLDLMNDEREDAGVDDLIMDADLQSAAMERAAELALNFSHTRPDGTSCFTITSLAFAENVAAGYSTPSAVTAGWMDSSGHKANMLNSSYTTVGIGCARVGSIYFWVQLFGTGTATETDTSGTIVETYSIDVSYDTVPFDDSGFNLNMSQDDPEPLEIGETYELTVGIPNAGWSGVYAHTSGSGYTWESSDTSVITVDSSGLVTAVGKGEAAITATSAGGYTWTKNFEVSGISLSSATVTLSTTSYTYNGTARKPSVTVKLDGDTLAKGTDYTVTYENNTDAGTASVIITGKGNYSDSVTKTFTISQKSIASSSSAAKVTLATSSYTYNGTAKKPTPTVKITLNSTATTLTKGTDYTVSYSNNTKAGTATVIITGTGNYKGTLTKTFTINQKSIASSSSAAKVTLSTTSYTYNGNAKKPAVTLKITLNGSTKTLTKGTDYTVSYKNNTKIGTATVTIKGTGNYKGTLTKTFKIKPKQGTISSLKSSAKKKMTVKWKTVSGSVTKYQVRYRVKGTSKWTTKTYSSSTKSKTITGLKSGKTYQVQVRAYKTVSGKKYYGSWSSTKTVKVK